MTLTGRAENARKELFDRYDQLNALWVKAEEELTRLHIPRPVHYTYASYDADPCDNEPWQIHHCLGLQKVKGKWRICYCTMHDAFPEMPEDWTPITESSAEIRVKAAKHLPGLREAAVTSAEAFIPEVGKAIEALTHDLGFPDDDHLKQLLAERAKMNGRVK